MNLDSSWSQVLRIQNQLPSEISPHIFILKNSNVSDIYKIRTMYVTCDKPGHQFCFSVCFLSFWGTNQSDADTGKSAIHPWFGEGA